MKKTMVINLLIFGMVYHVQSFAMESLIDGQSYMIDLNTAFEFGYYSFDKCKAMIKSDLGIPLAWHKPNSGDPCTMLHIAVEKDNVLAARALLEAGALVNAPTRCNNYTPLHMVCSKPMAKLLLSYKANLSSKDKEDAMPLYHVLFGSQGLYSGYYCLKQLNSHQRQEIACYLLKKGADQNATVDKDGRTLLHKAIGSGYSHSARHPEYIDLLLRHSADLECKDKIQETPYELAIRMFDRCEGALKVLKRHNVFFIQNDYTYGDLLELLKDGAQKFKDLVGQDVISGNKNLNQLEKELAELLIMARRNFDSDKGKINPYDKKGYCFNKSSYKCLENWVGEDSIEYLHQRFDNCCQHVLLLVKQGKYSSVEIYKYPFVLQYNKKIVFDMLLQVMIEEKKIFSHWVNEFKADISVTDEDGNTLLHKAIELEDVEAIALLIENKASLATPNKRGKTPKDLLDASEHSGSIEAFKQSFIDLFFDTHSYEPAYCQVKKIIKDGFDVNSHDKCGKPMLLRAIKAHHEKCLLLLKHGALVTQKMLDQREYDKLSEGIQEVLSDYYQNQK